MTSQVTGRTLTDGAVERGWQEHPFIPTGGPVPGDHQQLSHRDSPGI